MFPVAIGRAPSIAPKLIARVMRDAAQRRRFSIFDLRIGDQRYQVVSRLRYTDSSQHEIQGVFGFVVNVGWVTRNYFGDIIKQVGRIAGTESTAKMRSVLSTTNRTTNNGVAAHLPSSFIKKL